MTNQNTHNSFIKELTCFLLNIAGENTIVTTRELKRWIRGLDAIHPVKVSYCQYLNLDSAADEEFGKITNHMKFVPGYYQTRAYARVVGKGINSRVIYVSQNKIKISSK